jgi:very-short-patch-repair endonuclease
MSVALSKPRKAFSEETKRRMRESQWIKKRIAEGLPHPQKGKPQYWCRGENNPAKRPEVRRKISEKQRLFLKEHPELWLNAKLAKLNRASKPQLRLLNIVKQAFPDAQLNSRILGTRRFADVGVPSEKVDFEFNGEYWHRNREKEDEERILEINRAGWSVFIIEQRHLDHHDVEALLGLPDMMEHL